MAEEVNDEVDDFDDWNEEIADELDVKSQANIVVYSRDWTVETILSQISKGNIDLNPEFQRRNAWNDVKRSRLIESILLGVPIPEIILAEQTDSKNAYIVVDGKQRLLAIKGFIDPEYRSWNRPVLTKLDNLTNLNGKSYFDLGTPSGDESDIQRAIMNADMRCTVISNFKSEDVLYDIFNRINSGSVSLSSQELRQSLHGGEFSNFLIEFTNNSLPLHSIIGSNGPDRRLRDAEILLRYLAINLLSETYNGAIKSFLDNATEQFNKNWGRKKEDILTCLDSANTGCNRLIEIFGAPRKAGRRFNGDKMEGRFNRSLFEAELFYVSRIPEKDFTPDKFDAFVDGLKRLCNQDTDFVDSIGSTTKTKARFEKRFRAIMELTNAAFGTSISDIPIRES